MKNSDKVAELRGLLNPDNQAEWISNLWTKYNNQRQEKLAQWAEVDNYIYATDTTTTANSTLPWTHNTTLPKLTQIRDNLHANYLSALFPNDKWLTWVAYTKDAAKKTKASTITAYMENKTREGGFRQRVSRLLYDYIDKGNSFAMPSFETRYNTNSKERTTDFVGPKVVRIDPMDIVFNPLAESFENTFKIVRSVVTLGELKALAEVSLDESFWDVALAKHMELRKLATTYTQDDWQKANQYLLDGFGSLHEYYNSDVVEILEFYGDYHNAETGELVTNRMVTVVDRTTVVRDIPIPTYGGKPAIRHVGWRLRSNNLWAMGPLDNLVGMQYMLDHYINMSANALDLKVMPPKKIIGDVEAFDWGPNVEIHIDENGDVQEMAQQYGDIAATTQFIEQIEFRMELYAGAPREAMGIRTPGEKTAFEIQTLENAAGRIFQEKIIQFELFLEDVLNDMLEITHRNMDFTDTIRIIDNDIGVKEFRSITKEDITADGILRPIGARHYSQKAQELQNLVGVFNSPIGQMILPHTSAIGLTDFIKDVVNLQGYNIFQPNIAISEQQETQALATQASEDNIMKSQISEEELLAQAGGR